MHEIDHQLKIRGAAAVYRLFAADGELLYVGMTKDVGRRFRDHSHEKDWWHLVARHEIVQYETRGEAACAEDLAINTERPTRNRFDPIASREASWALTPPPREASGSKLKLPALRSGDRHKGKIMTVRFPAPQRDRLKQYAAKVGKGEREVVREAITEYLDKHDPDTNREQQS
jgi:predicted GIY-YIG superfamily endonuclease